MNRYKKFVQIFSKVDVGSKIYLHKTRPTKISVDESEHVGLPYEGSSLLDDLTIMEVLISAVMEAQKGLCLHYETALDTEGNELPLLTEDYCREQEEGEWDRVSCFVFIACPAEA